MTTPTLESTAHTGWRQRYLAWATAYYAKRLPHETAQQARQFDEFLLGPKAWGLWLGLLCGATGSTVGLVYAGFPWPLALLVTLIVIIGLVVAASSAWLQPERVLGGQAWKALAKVTAGAFGGAMAGFMVGRAARHGSAMFDNLGPVLLDAARSALPALLVVIIGTVLLMVAVAWARRQAMQRELQALRLISERDAAARQAVEAQLKLLQGQIQPHFIFNTLSAVQHWVDSGDARAGPLLRSLTAFLRGSTELLGRDSVRLADELAMAGHYLDIMQARLGQRLRQRLDIDASLRERQLPPGLLLTLVENAVEHGVSAALAGACVTVQAQSQSAGWTISVHDDGAGLPAAWTEGVGLANSRQRLAHHFGARAQLQVRATQPGTEARITIAHA